MTYLTAIERTHDNPYFEEADFRVIGNIHNIESVSVQLTPTELMTKN